MNTRENAPRIGRREAILFGMTGMVILVDSFGRATRGALAADTATPILSTPALEEGPYWIDETRKAFHRTDIRSSTTGHDLQPGVPLSLDLKLSKLQNGALTPLSSAYVYLWHCNASGVYSGEPSQNSQDANFLRGYQTSDSAGKMAFTTIYPGWYGGRTVHIHARVRVYPQNNPTQRPTYDFETQFFFDDSISDRINQNVSPYNQRERDRDTYNTNDHVYSGSSLDSNGMRSNAGAHTLLKLTHPDSTHVKASLDLVLNLNLKERTGGFGGPGGPGGGPGGPDGTPPGGDGGPPPPPPN